MPDFFKEREEKQALRDHYANLRHVTVKTATNVSPLSGEAAGCNPGRGRSNSDISLDDTKIQTWFTDLLDDDKIGIADSDQEMGDDDELEDDQEEELEESLAEVSYELDQASAPDISPCLGIGKPPLLDLSHVSTSMDFSENCMIGENHEQVILSLIGILLADFSVSECSLAGT